MVYDIIPTSLGRNFHPQPIPSNQPGYSNPFFIAHLSNGFLKALIWHSPMSHPDSGSGLGIMKFQHFWWNNPYIYKTIQNHPKNKLYHFPKFLAARPSVTCNRPKKANIWIIKVLAFRIPLVRLTESTLPETNIATKNGWLEYYFPIGARLKFRGELLVSGKVTG